jgi:ElaB/YqjD/DUF883 family membrane-anchored ribosome-binding protein
MATTVLGVLLGITMTLLVFAMLTMRKVQQDLQSVCDAVYEVIKDSAKPSDEAVTAPPGKTEAGRSSVRPRTMTEWRQASEQAARDMN